LFFSGRVITQHSPRKQQEEASGFIPTALLALGGTPPGLQRLENMFAVNSFWTSTRQKSYM
jgi:hypothetical protein